MKPRFALRSFLALAGSSLLAISSASAQSGTWITDGNGNWNDTANWSGGTIATGSGNTANLTAELTADSVITLGVDRTIGNITFTDGTTSSNNLSITGNTLTLAGTTPTINVTQSDRTLSISSILTGTSGFTKMGAGTLVLNRSTSSNTITGSITVSEGILKVGNGTDNISSLNSRPVSIASGAELQIDHVLTGGVGTEFGALSGSGKVNILTGRRINLSSAQTNSGDLAFQINGTLGITHGSSLAIHLGELSGSGTIQRAGGTTSGAPTLHIGGKNTDSTFSGTISPSGTPSAMSVNKVGSGILTLTGTSAYTGTTTISNGTLQLGNGGSTGTISSSSSIVNNSSLVINNTATQTLGAISGTGSVSYTGGAGSLTLNNTTGNNFSGGFTLNSGNVSMTSSTYNVFGTGLVTIKGGSFDYSNGSSFTFNNDMQWDTQVRLSRAGTHVFSGDITLGGNSGWINGSTTTANTVTFNGDISETGGSRSFTISTGTISHTVTFNGQNSFTGNLVGHSNTALVVGGSGYLGGGNYAGNITMGSFAYNSSANQTLGGIITGATLTKGTSDTSTLILSGISSNVISGLTTVNAGTLELNKSGTATAIQNGGLTMNTGGIVQYNASAGTNQIGDSSVVTIAGGTFNTNGINDTVGRLIHNSGTVSTSTGTLTLSANNAAALSMRDTTVGVNLALSNTTTTGVGITFDATNNGKATINGGLNLNSSATTGITRTLTINDGSAAIDMEIAGVVSDTTSTGLTKAGAGTLALTNANTYRGVTTISAGTLQIGNGGTTGTLSTSSTITNNATLAFNRSDTITQGTDFRNVIGGSGAVVQNGSGTLVLNGVNTYSGATTVNSGVLEVSAGNINASSGVSINGGEFRYGSGTGLTRDVSLNGGTFRYNSSVAYTGTLTYNSGTLAGTKLTGTAFNNQIIGTNKSIAPGNSPGTMEVVDQTWASGGTYFWEIYNATGAAGTGWDLLSGTGTLDVTATVGSEFIIDLTSLSSISPDTLGNAINFNASTSYAWLIADFASVTNFNATDFTIDTAGFTNSLNGAFGVSLGGVGAVPGDNTQVYLTYTAIPEPGAALLGGLGILLIFRRRR